jgi:Ni/Co efflux regulator RcnB
VATPQTGVPRTLRRGPHIGNGATGVGTGQHLAPNPQVTPVIQVPVAPQIRGRRTIPEHPTVIPGQPTNRHEPRTIQHQPVPPVGIWNRNLRGPDNDRAADQWRREHHGWDRASPWQRNPNWWQHNRAFRFYFGPRIGFFFIPNYGYIAAPQQYRINYFRPGDYLPSWFWRYIVRDYSLYGLPPPPSGCAWVWVDNDVALIDLSDGYIIDIVHNVW